ncbi:Flp family type IVb pilin [Paraburkholderia silviterrae]|uniref:Flp family type IVb pilin n=1 Tax=Paraburkholderia silviterrae TaxID=2528715 RepID=A0A4R5MDV2_9BURK|nr:Flp family type IVb pilin [Paraburkholderia silviterrae]TDG25272.1 Flp family type IVb pilin [Paraburkholderia silviterrae]
MNKLLKHFAKSEEGVTALEYGLIAGVIVIAVASTVPALGTQLTSLFNSIEGKVATAASNAAG